MAQGVIIPKREMRSDSEKYALPKPGEYNFKRIPLDDPRVFSLFASGRTVGVFQLEKQLGQDWSRKAKPNSIDEIGVLVSILRPGPLESGFSDQYVKRKHGEEEVEYLHPALEPILRETYGCLIYQEQAMRIAVDLAGFTEVEADDLRKAIGKKNPEVMSKVKTLFKEKAKIKGIVTEKEADEIFSWIEKAVRYSFNKSHAISYAETAYFCAYQKVHFPTEFYCSWLSFSSEKPDAREEIYNLVQDAKLRGIEVLPPDIRKHNTDFEVVGDKKVIFGLSHIRGVGTKATEVIKELGDELNTFNGFLRCGKKMKRNVAESLIKAGACDCYGISRSYMLKCVYAVLGRNEKDPTQTAPEVKPLTPKEYEHLISKLDELGLQGALSSVIESGRCVKKRIPTIEAKLKYLSEKVFDTNRGKSIWEKLYLGLNLTCSAADDIDKIERNVKTCREVNHAAPDTKVVMHCVIDEIRMRKTSEKSRNPGCDFCYLAASDNTGAVTNMVCWPEVYEKIKHDLAQDVVATIYGRKESWNGREQIVIFDIKVIG
jgi:DNA polymerase III alpha subunit